MHTPGVCVNPRGVFRKPPGELCKPPGVYRTPGEVCALPSLPQFFHFQKNGRAAYRLQNPSVGPHFSHKCSLETPLVWAHWGVHLPRRLTEEGSNTPFIRQWEIPRNTSLGARNCGEEGNDKTTKKWDGATRWSAALHNIHHYAPRCFQNCWKREVSPSLEEDDRCDIVDAYLGKLWTKLQLPEASAPRKCEQKNGI